MIISRTPFRISFFGGGTDYGLWVRQHGGAVLSTTFDKYCYINCRDLPPFFDHNYRITYSRVENTQLIGQIEHPAVRAVLNEVNLDCGLEIHCDADLPARSGLGSSSAFIVGLLNSLYALKGQRVTSDFLAHEAIRIEQKVIRDNVGSQDQVAAAYGGFNIIHFMSDGGFRVEPVIIPTLKKEELNNHLMLFFTGFSRVASEVAKSKIDNIKHKTAELHHMRSMVDQGVNILSTNQDIRSFGELLHEAWGIKRTFSDKVSTPIIDALYNKARNSGAIGGKLLGAGGGGFLLLFVEPNNQKKVREVLHELIHVPFKFESTGSQIIYYHP